MVVRDGGLAGVDGVARDLVERVDREGRRAVGGGQQISIDAERLARDDLRVLVHAVRPEDLLGRRESARRLFVRPLDDRLGAHRLRELAAADGEDAARAADLVLFRGERKRLVGLPAGEVLEAAGLGVVGELVSVLGILDGLGRLHDLESEVEGVPAEDVAHVVPADDDHRQPDLFRHGLEAGRAHLSGGADREAVARDEEGLARVHALAEVGHEVAKGPFLPLLVERVETLGDAVLGRRDLVGIDRVELLSRPLGVPEDQGASGQLGSWARGPLRRGLRGLVLYPFFAPGRLDSMHGFAVIIGFNEAREGREDGPAGRPGPYERGIGRAPRVRPREFRSSASVSRSLPTHASRFRV